MKVAVIGSRNLSIENLEDYIPQDCTEIVSGGAKGVDSSAAQFAKSRALKLTEFLPQYSVYGKAAPIIRNKQIVDYADCVLAFWDGVSKGTHSVIRYCEKLGKPYKVVSARQEL
jgi:predicted Rossmann fold nucleotide-binding protein DprA/Smf involved in DNA uptake